MGLLQQSGRQRRSHLRHELRPQDRRAKGTYPFPGNGPLCNDIAVAQDGTAYVTDTRLNSVLMLKPGTKSLVVVANDPLLAGADGWPSATKPRYM